MSKPSRARKAAAAETVLPATSGEERVLETRLGRLVSDAKVSGIEPPAVIVVGANAALRAVLAPGMVKP